MGSLFTRAFVFFWATVVVFALTAAALTTINFLADAVEPQREARQGQAILDAGGLPALRAWLATENAQFARSGQRLLVLDPSGRDILGQPRRLHGRGLRPDPPPDLRAPLPPDLPVFPRITAADGVRYVLLFDPAPLRGPFAPPFSRKALLALLALAIAVSGLIAYAFARSISRPLERLTATARRLADGRLDTRTALADTTRRDEIGVLAREFDVMAVRLVALVEARKHLLRDVSHELRSPLARLQIAVGLARQPGADAARQLERIERESGRLEALIARILEYARLERDPATLLREDVDLVGLVRRVVHDAQFEASAAPDHIRLALAPAVDGVTAYLAAADAGVLHTAVDNVVRNALLHGGDAAIEVTLTAADDELVVEVRDHGPGVPAADLERIFEPFYRVPVTEGAHRADGHGIGLALARRA